MFPNRKAVARITATTFTLLLTLSAAAGNGKVVRGSKPIPNRYIVVLESNFLDESPAEVRTSISKGNTVNVLHNYTGVFQGFLIESTDQVAQAISRDPRVSFVEQDNQLSLAANETASWALDRIDDRAYPRIDGTFEVCSTDTGQRTFVYVFDTGIWAGHSEFANQNTHYNRPRVQPGFDLYYHLNLRNESANPCEASRLSPGSTNGYNAAHGTAVASLIGGSSMGTAPGVILRPVRVADCDGSIDASSVLRGADWVLGQNDPQWSDPNGAGDHAYVQGAPRIVNMSFEGVYYDSPGSTTIEVAVNKLIDNNVTVVVAAGNGKRAVSDGSSGVVPARVPRAITVGGSRGSVVSDTDRVWDDATFNGVLGSITDRRSTFSLPHAIFGPLFGRTPP